MATKTTNQSKTNINRLFGAVTKETDGRSIAGLMLLDPSRIETAAQPRTQFDDTGLSELAGSIRERREKGEGVENTGILQPLLVSSPQTGTYLLIAGERRLRAARKLQLPLVPVIVVADNPRERLISQLVENLQRANLNPLEEALALDAWIKENKFSVRDAAAAIGKDKNYISNRVRLLKMGEDVQQMVSARADALVHAQIIQDVSESRQRQQLIKSVIEDGVSVAELRRLISSPKPQTENGLLSLRRDSKQKSAADEEDSTCEDENNAEDDADKVSLRRDTSPTFAEKLKSLKATETLLDSFENPNNLRSDMKITLKRRLFALSRKIQRLERALND